VKGRCPRPLDDGDVRGSPILPANKQVTKCLDFPTINPKVWPVDQIEELPNGLR
jgi:hypothetical protein